MRRVARITKNFDADVISRELDKTDLKNQFSGSWELTHRLFRELQAAHWDNATLKEKGASSRVFFIFKVLQETFQQEANAYIQAHQGYAELRAKFESRTQGISQKQPHYHKQEFLFQFEANKLIDGTIAWHMRKFIGKFEEAICKTRSPSEMRRGICLALDILDLGLKSHFPMADRRLQKNPITFRKVDPTIEYSPALPPEYELGKPMKASGRRWPLG